jgi:hypothetical protein
MKLLRATFLSIRGVADATHELGDPTTGQAHDVVLITGPAASGKTRLLEAILAAKEVIAPYGPMMTGARWLAPGAPSGKIVLTFQLDDEEQRRVGSPGPSVTAEALFTEERCRCDADDALVTLLQHYAHDERWGKIEYLPANRGVSPPGAMHGLSAIEQRLLRATRDPRKYSFLPRLLFAFTWDAAYAAARDRFQAALASLSSTARYLGPNQEDPTRCFSSRGGPRVDAGELSDAEGHAVILAAMATLIRLRRSILLVDRPELSADERSVASFLHAARGLAPDLQLIAATSSPALVAAADPRTVLTLG